VVIGMPTQHDDPAVPVLWRLMEAVDELAAFRDDPVLEDRVGFLQAYVYDLLRLKDPFGAIPHASDR
jgi:hypothetical protein